MDKGLYVEGIQIILSKIRMQVTSLLSTCL